MAVRLVASFDRPSGLTPNHKPGTRREIGLLPRFQACRLNRPSPELRRENGLGAAGKPVVTFSNPQAATAKAQETCGSARHRRIGNVRLENRLEQRWEPGTEVLCVQCPGDAPVALSVLISRAHVMVARPPARASGRLQQ
jgi:hypothetical protein